MAMGLSPRDFRRMLRRMGIEAEEVKATDVVISLADGSKLVIESPQVMRITARGQPPLFYVAGNVKTVEPPRGPEEGYTEEDVRLVAEQAGVSIEEARKALEESGGDIAAAILKLRGHEP